MSRMEEAEGWKEGNKRFSKRVKDAGTRDEIVGRDAERVSFMYILHSSL